MPGQKVRFPSLEHLVLRGFSLFSSRGASIPLAVEHDVFCFAGANGIGKSTVIAAISYGLTGIVAEPQRKFTSVDEYYQDCVRFPREYFNGRIKEKDRDHAEVEVGFLVGDHRYHLVRGLFEPDALRALRITRAKEILLEGRDLTPQEREEHYRTRLANDVGVKRFQQYAFLHNFVLTFDERHHLLFWDQTVLEQALYLAFGVDFESAQRADDLRREIDRAESRMRNANWQANEVAKKVKELERQRKRVRSEAEDDEVIEYQNLVEARERATALVEERSKVLGDAELLRTRSTAKLAEIQRRFREAFQRRTEESRHWARHPIFFLSKINRRCALCGDASGDVVSRVQETVAGNHCPLCGARQDKNDVTDSIFEELVAIDKELEERRSEVDVATQRVERTSAELAVATEELEAVSARLAEFEASSPGVVGAATSTVHPSELDAILTAYQRQRSDFLELKARQKQRRDKAKSALEDLRRDLEAKYSEAQVEFVPDFRQLAHLFLGIDLDVEMQSRSSGVQLVVEVRGEKRREHFSLSESQKFFVDIALRMAIANHLSAHESPASLLIDTPEGSLDIAYEARAGEMFAAFVERGNRIVMTANINSSKLLIRLAERCGRAKMDFVRMMDWAELSEVQQKEEALFEEAFTQIEGAFDQETS